MWPFKKREKTPADIAKSVRQHIARIAEMGYPASHICEAFGVVHKVVRACLEEFGTTENALIVKGVHYFLRPPVSPVSNGEIELDIMTEDGTRIGYISKYGDEWTAGADICSDDRFRAATAFIVALNEQNKAVNG
jgi:hypothetical protein